MFSNNNFQAKHSYEYPTMIMLDVLEDRSNGMLETWSYPTLRMNNLLPSSLHYLKDKTSGSGSRGLPIQAFHVIWSPATGTYPCNTLGIQEETINLTCTLVIPPNPPICKDHTYDDPQIANEIITQIMCRTFSASSLLLF